jgi:hypothetical protein
MVGIFELWRHLPVAQSIQIPLLDRGLRTIYTRSVWIRWIFEGALQLLVAHVHRVAQGTVRTCDVFTNLGRFLGRDAAPRDEEDKGEAEDEESYATD